MAKVPAFPVPVSPAEFERELPAVLQYALERRYLEGFDVSRTGLVGSEHYDVQVHTRFFPLLEIAHGADVQRSLHELNMQNVLSSLRDGSHTLAFLAKGDGQRVRLYLGVCRLDFTTASMSTDEYIEILHNALCSNFPGLDCGEVLDAQAFQEQVRSSLGNLSCVAGFTGIPALKRGAEEHFVQGLERLVDGLRGERYCFLVLAEPLREAALNEVIDRCHRLSSEIHMQVSQRITAGRSRGSSEGRQRTEGYTVSLGAGILQAFMGFSTGLTQSRSRSEGRTASESLSVGREALNKTAQYCEQMLDHHVARLLQGKSLGFWNAGVYLLADNRNTLLHGQGIIRGLFAGPQGQFEPLRAIDLTPEAGMVQASLVHFRNPTLAATPGGIHPLGEIFHTLATPLTTEELAVVISFPRREVPGVKLRPMAEFGINPPVVQNGVVLGQVIYQGEELDQPLGLAVDDLTQHTFVTGITGAGKTNTCLVLLQQIHQRGVPFLVIEPAKTEYRALLADDRLCGDLQVYTLGEETTSPLRLNPFEFVPGFNLLTHIDFLKAVFNASFPLYASMPYILEEAILEVYTDRGWDPASSANRFVGEDHDDYTAYLPTLEDLYDKIDAVVERKRYAERLTMDISAALKARLQSLLNGGKGLMLNTQRSVGVQQLLDHPTVLELRHIGDDDEKAFLMALILILIYEHAQTQRSGSGLQHLTLVEEAHRLLKNIPPSISVEVASSRGKAVEMFTDILAEVREYGEGFVIVDQIPSKLAPDVVKNTNLKILHRLVAYDDRCFVGNAMSLNDEQNEHVVRLRPGQAAVHCAGLDTPVLVKVGKAKDDLKKKFEREAGLDGLRTHMRDIRRRSAEAYRRWPGCSICDAPCEYLSAWNRPDELARASFGRLLNALLLSDADDYMSIWRETQDLLEERLRSRYQQAHWRTGVFLCHLVQLSRAAIADWCEFYARAGSSVGAAVELQRLAADLVRALRSEVSSEDIEPKVSTFRESMWQRVAREPPEAVKGCRLCQRPCRFAYLVQRHSPVDRQNLTRGVRQLVADAQLEKDYRYLVQLAGKVASDAVGIPLPSDVLGHLGFCYLCNHTSTERHLRGYQSMLG